MEIAVVHSYEAEKNRKKKEENNRRKAKKVIQDIYAMLNQRNVKGAYSKFNNIKILLKKYSSKDDFLKLQNAVVYAYESYKKEIVREEKVNTKTGVARATPVVKPVRVVKPTQEEKPVRIKKAVKTILRAN